MKRIVVAGMLGLAAFAGLHTSAMSQPLFGTRGASETVRGNAPVIHVQGGDASVRIQQLEEQIRQLNGRIEEMSFQLLQMQEQIRKAQEDNEFRFQELEKSDNSTGKAGQNPAAPGGDDVARIIEEPSKGGSSANPGHRVTVQPTAPAGNGTTAPPATAGSGKAPGETVLGSIKLDKSGMPVGGTMNDGANNSAGLPGVDSASPAPAADPARTAGLSSENDVYQAAYSHVLAGDYALAERGFEEYIKTHPAGAKAADANFWLGEAQYSQGKFNDAAKTFLNAHQAFGKSPRAPEMLLKLGMSLAQLDNNETACATFREVTKRYPSAPRAVLTRVASEQKRLRC